ncbi:MULTISPECIES: hypothetical protein [Paraburkholderia]|uniref:Uncharacterized protein n=1 Tax=Paraburkholderia acidicola TaxID=1912599 RepID=A0ABV1M0Q1_9BURK
MQLDLFYRGTHMKIRTNLLMSLLLTASSLALAQGTAGSGHGGGGAADNSAGVASGATTGNGSEMPASSTMSHSKSMRKHPAKSSQIKKPENDTTNIPGADASSDAKGK